MKRKQIISFIFWFCLINTLILAINGLGYKISDSLLRFHQQPQLKQVYLISYLIISYISHFALLAFIPALFLSLLAFIIPKRTVIIPLLVLFSTLILIILNVDIYAFNNFRLHFEGVFIQMVFDIIKHQTDQMFDISNEEYIFLLSVSLILLTIESLIAYWLTKKLAQVKNINLPFKIALFLAVMWYVSFSLFVFSFKNGTVRITQSATRFLPFHDRIISFFIPEKNAYISLQRISEGYFVQPGQYVAQLNYPNHPMVCVKPQKPLNIVLIAIDTWRYDMMNSNVTPHIFDFSKISENYSNHFSGGNSTLAGIFSLYYSIPATYWTAILDKQLSPVFINQLLQEHYDISVLASASLKLPEFNKTIFAPIKNLQISAQGSNPLERDQHITNEFIQYIKNRKSQKPFFSYLFYDSAHSYCRVPYRNSPFSPAIQKCNRALVNSKKDYLAYFNRYKNGLYLVDQQIGKVLNELEKQNLLSNTVIIITGDHGEEFNDSGMGYLGHASGYSVFQTKTPFILHTPGIKAKNLDYVTTHYDIMPTLLKNYLGCKNELSDYSIGLNLHDQSKRPYLIIASYTDYAFVKDAEVTRIYPAGDYEVSSLTGKILANKTFDSITFKNVVHEMRRFFKS